MMRIVGSVPRIVGYGHVLSAGMAMNLSAGMAMNLSAGMAMNLSAGMAMKISAETAMNFSLSGDMLLSHICNVNYLDTFYITKIKLRILWPGRCKMAALPPRRQYSRSLYAFSLPMPRCDAIWNTVPAGRARRGGTRGNDRYRALRSSQYSCIAMRRLSPY